MQISKVDGQIINGLSLKSEGIELINCSNCVVSGCTIFEAGRGISLHNCHNCTVRDNIIRDCIDSQIHLENCLNSIAIFNVSADELKRVSSHIRIINGNSCTAESNYLSGGIGNGISIEGNNSTLIIVKVNTLYRTGHCGILVGGGHNQLYTGNRIIDTNMAGGIHNAGIKVIRLLPDNQLMSEIAVIRNHISNLMPDGTYNDLSIDDVTVAKVVKRGNVFGKKARMALMKVSG